MNDIREKSDLNERDAKLLRIIGKNEPPVWSRISGRLLIVLGCLSLFFWLFAVLTGMSNRILTAPGFDIGVMSILYGTLRLQDYRYRIIIKHLLNSKSNDK